MSIKGILFDFNGTLFFDSELHLLAFSQCFTDRGMKPLDREYVIRNIFGKQNEEIYRTYFDANATDEEQKAFAAEKEGKYIRLCSETDGYTSLCKGAEEMLEYLKANGIPFCIATGSDLENVEFYFKHLKLDKWFSLDNIVYTDGSFRGKPAPDIYELAAARIGLSPSECVVFEDGTSGLRAAKAAGVETRFAIHEKGLPSPVSDDVSVCGEYNDFSEWRAIFKEIGLIKS